MNTGTHIGNMKSSGRAVLTDPEAKKILREYGLPMVEETVAKDFEELLIQASAFRYPVVLKAHGTKLTHKTEKGLVRLSLRNEEDLQEAAKQIAASAGSDLEGYLVQPMLSGRREFIMGFVRDTQFGPVVMFGLGGILTEALNDITFRIAPFDESTAEDMINEIRSASLLAKFRGEDEADRKQIIQALVGLARFGVENPEVVEADINPLLVGPDGHVTAVDALVVLGHSRNVVSASGNLGFLDAMLSPKSLAVVGAKRPSSEKKWSDLTSCIVRLGYKGRFYPINPEASEIDGIQAYPDLTSLPEPVDLVIVSVPAPQVPAVLRDCVSSGNKNVHIFTAGFKETGGEEGLKLQRQIEEIAESGGLRVIGPNCMGIFNPKVRIATWAPASMEVGPVAFISQSGGFATDLTRYAGQFGIHFSKVISYGNALTLDSTDFLEYLGRDDETKLIILYLEGVKDGAKLLSLVKEIRDKKPILLMKGGLTASGARTVSSHTGALAGGEHAWNAFFRQTGTIKVTSIEEMTDVTLALLNLPPPQGGRVGVIGTGGGIGVEAADTITRAGLELPALTEGTKRKLAEFIPQAGNFITNPVDAGILFSQLGMMERTLRVLASDPMLDLLVVSIHIDWFYNADQGAQIEKLASYLAGPGREQASGKPFVVSLRRYQTDSGVKHSEEAARQILLKAGIPVYKGLQRTAFALAKMVDYYRFRGGIR
ncbi:MAG: acetate--CoA ligase family protein [Deltaproteobacteria bacterium]|nr:acetate--CoA ligase family protein [Deltaproteobacteria bacterium]